jgi:hypothetical protein
VVALLALLVLAAGPGYGAAVKVTLSGDVHETPLSGFKGSAFSVPQDDSTSKAVFGVISQERSDEPCLLKVSTEDVNDSAKDGSAKKDLCGPKGATSSDLLVNYADTGVQGPRVFVTGIRVCMNNDKTRVKGFTIRGKKITDSGTLADLETSPNTHGQAGGSDVGGVVITEPSASRTNCDEKDGMMKFVECDPGQVAIGLVGHFEAGETPRSLTGVALRCRALTPASVHAEAAAGPAKGKLKRRRPGAHG